MQEDRANALRRAIPRQQEFAEQGQIVADDRLIEAIRTGQITADDSNPLVGMLVQWRTQTNA